MRIGVKIVLLLVILSTQVPSSYSTEVDKTDREKADLRGLVKTVTTRDASPIITIDLYDRSGKLVKRIVKDVPSNAIRLRIVITYDAKGKKLNETSYDSSGVVSTRKKYTYDASGRHLGKIWFSKEGLLKDATFVRSDSSGRPEEEIAVDVVNGVMRKHTYKYDATGNSISEVVEAGNEVREISKSYNSRHLLVEEVVKTSDGKVNKVLAYDNEDNVISRETYNGDGELLDKWSYSYEYDSQRNWTKMKTDFLMRNGNPISERTVIERTITYFEK